LHDGIEIDLSSYFGWNFAFCYELFGGTFYRVDGDVFCEVEILNNKVRSGADNSISHHSTFGKNAVFSTVNCTQNAENLSL